MFILKRDGRKEEFYKHKIEISIKNSARDCGYPLNESDVNFLYKTILDKINKLLTQDKNRIISSLELKIILYESLKESEFNKVALSYINTI